MNPKLRGRLEQRRAERRLRITRLERRRPTAVPPRDQDAPSPREDTAAQRQKSEAKPGTLPGKFVIARKDLREIAPLDLTMLEMAIRYGLSSRAINCLQRDMAGSVTLRDYPGDPATARTWLRRIWSIGDKTVAEIMDTAAAITSGAPTPLAVDADPRDQGDISLDDLDLIPSVIWAVLDLDTNIRDAIVLRYGLRSEPFRLMDIASIDGSSLDDVATRIAEGKNILAQQVGPQLDRYLALMAAAGRVDGVPEGELNPFVRLADAVARAHP